MAAIRAWKRFFPLTWCRGSSPPKNGTGSSAVCNSESALNLFVDDVYHDQQIVKDNVVPPAILHSAASFRQQCVGLNPPHGIWCHITGTDLVRDEDGTVYVLEDNLRCPSGVSYVLREPRGDEAELSRSSSTASHVRPVEDYPEHACSAAANISRPTGLATPTVVVLTPGVYNSAYYEHSFLAQQMGVELVEGRDLVVRDGFVYMRTTTGLQRVDVIYRRIDDDFIDPQAFRPDSMLGVPGLMEVYRDGHVALANAPGTGVADDKVIYAYVPQDDQVLSQRRCDPLPNVPTYVCCDEEAAEICAGESRQARRQSGERVGRLRHAYRPARQR